MLAFTIEFVPNPSVPRLGSVNWNPGAAVVLKATLLATVVFVVWVVVVCKVTGGDKVLRSKRTGAWKPSSMPNSSSLVRVTSTIIA